MAKSQITQEDLAQGLGSVGLGNLSRLAGGAPRPRRASPFDSTTPELAAPVATPPQKREPLLEVELKRESEGSLTSPPIAPAPIALVEQVEGDKERETPVATQASLSASGKSESVVAPNRKKSAPLVSKESTRSSTTKVRKLDINTEKINFMVTPEVRDAVDELARKVQRQKTSKEERITSNTVLRVAVRALLDNFELDKYDVANSEEDLYKLVSEKMLRKR